MDKLILNKKLNQAEATEKKIVLDSKPLTLMVILTTRCNLKCIMCTRVRSKPQTLPVEAVNKIYSLFPYLEKVDWQGGEIFLIDYFKGLFLKTSEFANILQNITTNVLSIDKEWAKLLAYSNVNLLCSIDSVRKPTYESIRSGGKFEKLLKSLDLINEAKSKNNGNLKLDLITVVMKRNYRELTLFPEFCKKNNFRSLFLETLWPELVPEEDIFSNPEISTFQYLRQTINELKEKCEEYNIDFLCSFEDYLSDYIKKQENNPNGKENRQSDSVFLKKDEDPVHDFDCLVPWNNLFIDVNGGVRPDCKCIREVGNIKYNNCEEIWNGQAMQSYRRSIKNKQADKSCSDLCKFYATLRRREKDIEPSSL